MSWNCDICGYGHEKNHLMCSILEEMQKLNKNLEEIITELRNKDES